MGKLVRDKLAEFMANEQVGIDTVMADARLQIDKAMEKGGQYTHNMLSATLRGVAEKVGYRYANDLVREFDLTDLYDIPEVADDA